MRRPGPRALDVEKGVLTRQFKDGGLRQAEGGALLRKGLGRCWHGGIHEDAVRLSGLVSRQALQERPGLYEPDAVPKKPRSLEWEG